MAKPPELNVLIFGATGMVGQGALREALLDPQVEKVQTVGRTPSEQTHPKLFEVIHTDLWNYRDIEAQLTGFDACFFCLGTPSAGKSEADYTRVTFDLTLAAATTLARLNPQMTFIYISGDGADSTEKGNSMWARVRGRTENTLFGLAFKAVYVFRPGIIQPLNGIQSKTTLYRVFYNLFKPVLPLLRQAFPKHITTTENVGRALIRIARHGFSKRVLSNADINQVAESSAP